MKIMKNKTLVIIASILCFCLQLTIAAPAQADPLGGQQPIMLRVADQFPLTHFFSTDSIQIFMAAVEKRTGGVVTFEHFPATQLARASDLLNVLKSGMCDIAFVGPSYYIGEMPLGGGAFSLPNIYPDSVIGAEMYWNLCQPGGALYELEQKRHGIRTLCAIAYNGYTIMTTRRKVETFDDIRGMRIRGTGTAQEMAITNMGATSVNILPAELYEALSRGTIEGALFCIEATAPYNLQEVFNFIEDSFAISGFVGAFAISDASFNRLTPEVQAIFLEEGYNATVHNGNFLRRLNRELKEVYERDYNVEFYDFSETEKARFAEALLPVEEHWIEEMRRRGLGQEAKDLLVAARAEVERLLSR
jgi:TRAP-type C4-dicarboxylate transport system substrate-binding protein